jgi:prepilin-type N-terminal cleavage/methylation domain-containing protein
MIMRLRDRKGFTLVEVMIAVFVLTVALLGLISVTVMIIKGNDFSRRMTTATTLAKDKIEQVKKAPYNTISAGTTTDYLNIDSSTGTTGAYFTRILTVVDNTSTTNMKTVQVVVNWNWGGTRNVTLRTAVGQ